MAATQQVTGLASGFDTQSIVDQLMKIEKIPYDKLDVKKQTEQLRKQAYQAVNSMLLKFRTSVSSLSSQSLWKAKLATSTNESSLTATANQYAVNGSYSFRVAQLASSAQFMSKGFANSKTAFVKQASTEAAYKIGSVTLNSAKSRVDTSAKLDTLNGGRGVYRGSIRITDGSSNTEVIDLSSCDTMDDVLKTINNSGGAQVTASIKDGKLLIEDVSGGGGSLKIQNQGSGTTASDLGIAGTAEAGNKYIQSRSIYYLGNETALSNLRDGLGIEEGKIGFTINSGGKSVTVNVDLYDVGSVGDIVKRVNDEIAAYKDNPQVADRELLEGIKFGFNADGTGFALTGAKGGSYVSFFESVASNAASQTETASQLGLTDKVSYYVENDGDKVEFSRVLGGVNSPMLKNLSGANGTGVGSYEGGVGISETLTYDTLLSALNLGTGVDITSGLEIQLREGVSDFDSPANPVDAKVFRDILDPTKLNELVNKGVNTAADGDPANYRAATLKDLVSFVNNSLREYAAKPENEAAALSGLQIGFYPGSDTDSSAGPQLVWMGSSAAHRIEIGGSLAASLQLSRAGDNYALQNPDNTTASNAYKAQVDAFYASKSVVTGEVDHIDIQLEDTASRDATTLGDLDETKFPAGYDFLGSLNFKIGSTGNTKIVSLNYADFKDADGNEITDADGMKTVSVKDYLDVVNAKLKAAAGTDSAPQIKLGAYGNGFSWSNINFNNAFEASGTMAEAWGLDKSVVTSQAAADRAAFLTPGLNITADEYLGVAELDPTTQQFVQWTTPPATLADKGVFTDAGNYTGKIAFNLNGDDYEIEITAADNLDKDSAVSKLVEVINQKLWDLEDPDGNALHSLAPQVKVNIDNEPPGLVWQLSSQSSDQFIVSAPTGGAGVEDIAATLGLDKSSTPLTYSGIIDPIIFPTTNGGLQPATKAYYEEQPVTNDTMLGLLNGGKGLTFGGSDYASKSIDFDLGCGGKFSISMEELRVAIQSTGSLNTTLSQYADVLNGIIAQKKAADSTITGELKFVAEGDHLSISNIKGHDKIEISGNGLGAGSVGFGAVSITGTSAETTTKVQLSTLTAGEKKTLDVDGLGQVEFTVGNERCTLTTEGLTQDSTLQDLIDKLNAGVASESARLGKQLGVRFSINDAGTGIAVSNDSSDAITFVKSNNGSTLAQDLGLVGTNGTGISVDTYGHQNASDLGRRYMDRATSLSTLNGGAGVTLGSLSITDASGRNLPLDMTNCKTIGDVVDAINMTPDFGVKAIINERGDGITLLSGWDASYWNSIGKAPPAATGKISVSDSDGGNLAKVLGIAGDGAYDESMGTQTIKGSQRVTIDVMSSDTLESIMYKITEKGGSNYKTAIVNDGSGGNPYRLTVSSAKTGEVSDFVITSDLEMFGFNQTSRGKDSKVLYGDPSSGASPIMLSSSSNQNSNAILGLTLDLKSVSDTYTTISVDTDKSKVTEEIKNLAQTYNDLNDLVSYLDGYDKETGEKGVLFGDSAVRKLMEDINDMFYNVFNPDLLDYNQIVKNATASGLQQTWTWMDLGINLTAKSTNSQDTESGTWYSTMDLDLDKLEEMVSSNWDTLYSMLAGQRNAADSTLAPTVAATSTFNGTAASGFKTNNAINNNTSKESWGVNNGFMANGTIKEDGENQYTILFQKNTTLSRLSIYHMDSSTALKDFTVEYLDSATGKWETLRDVKTNSSDANHLGFIEPTTVSAIRITASSTNASDGKFRLLDVQCFEDLGLAGQLNQLTTKLGDVSTGWLAEQSDTIDSNIKDLEDQMDKLQERLDLKETSLWKRFTAMETALSQMQGQSQYFSTMMSSMSSSSSSKK